jgi:hypothetical protein
MKRYAKILFGKRSWTTVAAIATAYCACVPTFYGTSAPLAFPLTVTYTPLLGDACAILAGEPQSNPDILVSSSNKHRTRFVPPHPCIPIVLPRLDESKQPFPEPPAEPLPEPPAEFPLVDAARDEAAEYPIDRLVKQAQARRAANYAKARADEIKRNAAIDAKARADEIKRKEDEKKRKEEQAKIDRETTTPSQLFRAATHGLSLISKDYRFLTGLAEQLAEQLRQVHQLDSCTIFPSEDNPHLAILSHEQGLELQSQVVGSQFFLALEAFVKSRVLAYLEHIEQASSVEVEPVGEDFDLDGVLAAMRRLLGQILPSFVVEHLMERVDISRKAGCFLYGKFTPEQEKEFKERVHMSDETDGHYNRFGCICAIGRTPKLLFQNIVHELGHCIDFEMLEYKSRIGFSHDEIISTTFETIATRSFSLKARRDYCQGIELGLFTLYINLCSLTPESGNLHGPTFDHKLWTDVIKNGITVAERRLGADPGQFQTLFDEHPTLNARLIDEMRRWLPDVTKTYHIERMRAVGHLMEHPVSDEDSVLSYLDAVLSDKSPEMAFARFETHAEGFQRSDVYEALVGFYD